MSDPLVTLTTDFGEASPYVAALKGALLSVNPQARVLDLSHQIPPQDVSFAAYFLGAAIPYFPPEVIHVVVVDPGVGSERALLYVNVGGHQLLVPDNGCWTRLEQAVTEPPLVICLRESRFWRQPVSATFHGRDILAPVAGHLSRGLPPQQLGPVATTWVRLAHRAPVATADGWQGEVVFVDHFGNLLTNLPVDVLTGAKRILVADHEVPRRVRHYAEAEPGTLVVLGSSAGTVEIAVVQGSAANRLGVGVGAVVRLLNPGPT